MDRSTMTSDPVSLLLQVPGASTPRSLQGLQPVSVCCWALVLWLPTQILWPKTLSFLSLHFAHPHVVRVALSSDFIEREHCLRSE